jgi:hypothetical protein
MCAALFGLMAVCSTMLFSAWLAGAAAAGASQAVRKRARSRKKLT